MNWHQSLPFEKNEEKEHEIIIIQPIGNKSAYPILFDKENNKYYRNYTFRVVGETDTSTENYINRLEAVAEGQSDYIKSLEAKIETAKEKIISLTEKHKLAQEAKQSMNAATINIVFEKNEIIAELKNKISKLTSDRNKKPESINIESTTKLQSDNVKLYKENLFVEKGNLNRFYEKCVLPKNNTQLADLITINQTFKRNDIDKLAPELYKNRDIYISEMQTTIDNLKAKIKKIYDYKDDDGLTLNEKKKLINSLLIKNQKFVLKIKKIEEKFQKKLSRKIEKINELKALLKELKDLFSAKLSMKTNEINKLSKQIFEINYIKKNTINSDNISEKNIIQAIINIKPDDYKIIKRDLNAKIEYFIKLIENYNYFEIKLIEFREKYNIKDDELTEINNKLVNLIHKKNVDNNI